MARPCKNNLDKAKVDLNFDQQKEIKHIEARYGIIGFAIISKLFMYILRQGYYTYWSEIEKADFIMYTNVDEQQIEDIIKCSISIGIFDSKLYEAHKVLTSKKLQQTFFKACQRRKALEINTKFITIDISKYEKIITVSDNEINVHNNPVIEGNNLVNANNNIVNDVNNTINVGNNLLDVDNNTINVSNNLLNVDNNANLSNTKLSSLFDEFFENQ